MKKLDLISPEEKALFRTYVKNVQPLPHVKKTPLKTEKTLPHLIEPSKKVEELFTDTLPTPILEYGASLAFCRYGLAHPLFRRLKRGQFSITDEINLRHATVAQARRMLLDFLAQYQQRPEVCLKIIHGKGQRSATAPILKNYLNHWLRQHPAVLAFCSARPADGGTGAVYVLLQTKIRKLCP